jgi:hypothetical protein
MIQNTPERAFSPIRPTPVASAAADVLFFCTARLEAAEHQALSLQ